MQIGNIVLLVLCFVLSLAALFDLRRRHMLNPGV